MANDLIVPEILLIDKISECDNSLAPQVWEQMKNDVYNNTHYDSLINWIKSF